MAKNATFLADHLNKKAASLLLKNRAFLFETAALDFGDETLDPGIKNGEVNLDTTLKLKKGAAWRNPSAPFS